MLALPLMFLQRPAAHLRPRGGWWSSPTTAHRGRRERRSHRALLHVRALRGRHAHGRDGDAPDRAPGTAAGPGPRAASLSLAPAADLLYTTWQRVRSFLVDAGTIILAITIVLWAALSFPKSAEVTASFDARREALGGQGLRRGRARRGPVDPRRRRGRRAAPPQRRGSSRHRHGAAHRRPSVRLAHGIGNHRLVRGARGVRLDDGHRLRMGGEERRARPCAPPSGSPAAPTARS